MTQEQILEYNLLISVFDGWKKVSINTDTTTNFKSVYVDGITKGNKILRNHEIETHLNYRSNWNLLMSVVEKIGDTYIEGMQLGTEISGSKGFYSCVISGTHIYSENENQLIAVWECVVKFLKWYNVLNNIEIRKNKLNEINK